MFFARGRSLILLASQTRQKKNEEEKKNNNENEHCFSKDERREHIKIRS